MSKLVKLSQYCAGRQRCRATPKRVGPVVGMEAAGTVVVVGVADGAAGEEADGVRPSLWALPPHLLGVSDQVGAGDLAGEIHIGTRPVPVAAGCLSEFGGSVVRYCAQSGVAGDPCAACRELGMPEAGNATAALMSALGQKRTLRQVRTVCFIPNSGH